MAMRDKIEHAIQNQPCTVKDLKNKFGGDRGADRKVMEAVDQLVHEAVICQRQGVFFTVRSGRADKALLCKVVKLGRILPSSCWRTAPAISLSPAGSPAARCPATRCWWKSLHIPG